MINQRNRPLDHDKFIKPRLSLAYDLKPNFSFYSGRIKFYRFIPITLTLSILISNSIFTREDIFNMTPQFRGEPKFLNEVGDKYFSTFYVDQEQFSLGTCVNVKHKKNEAWIGEIISLWEDRNRSKWAECKWYYRPFQTGVHIDAFEMEVFESNHVEDVPLGFLFVNVFF
jgi:hypothetical protein